MSSFYIGLSRLSTLKGIPKPAEQSAQGRRILGQLEGRNNPPDTVIERGGGGRPYFSDRHADFSISHSRNMAAVAWISAGRVGCDIQYADPRKSLAEISRYFFSSGEHEYIAAASPRERIRRFYRIWVLKEAWLKLRGLSVTEMQKAPAFCAALPRGFFLYELQTGPAEQYMLAAVAEGDHSPEPEGPEFRWFSPPVPLVTSIAEI